MLKDNPVIVKALTKEKIFGVLNRHDSLDKLYREFMPIGERIHKAIR